jgi:outer membrane receptor protein involved in Fe transport
VGNLLVSHTSSVLFMYSAAPGFLPNDTGNGYWLTNARIGVKTADDKWGLALVADNVFNVGYLTSGDSLALGNSGAWGNPRVIRVEVTAKF